MARPPATLAEVRDLIETLRDELGELGGEMLHRSDKDREVWEAMLRDLGHIKSRVAVRKADKRAGGAGRSPKKSRI